MNISPATQLYAVLGHPIAHSLSPRMHNASLCKLGMDALYVAFDVHPDRLMTVLPVLAEIGFRGLNLTVPLKEVAFRGLPELDENASILGSVNTVKIEPDGLKGYSTDGDGFLMALEESSGAPVKGLSVFILGCGGAGRAVAIACARAGAKSINLANRNYQKAVALRDEIGNLCPELDVNAIDSAEKAWVEACRSVDLVVQSTSVGIHAGDQSLLPPEAFRPEQFLYDLVYVSGRTPFMEAAESAGARSANGLNMLLYQGVLSFRIWTGGDPDIEAMRLALTQEKAPRIGRTTDEE